MRYFHIATFLLFIACGGGGSGSVSINPAVYYIDPGAESNGTGSESSPFNTFSGVSFEPGAEYLIKRGTVLYEEITVIASGNPGDPVVIGAYGTGAEPVIDGSEIVNTASWINEGGSIYSNTLVPGSTYGRGNVTINGTVLKYTAAATPSAGEYTISSAGKIQIYGDPAGKTVRLSRRYFAIHGNNVSYIRIENVHIKQASRHGIHFEDSDNISVADSSIEMCGGSYIGSLQAGNGIEFGNSSANCTVTGCTISEIFDSGISPQTYDSNQTASGFTFTGNTISKCGFAGIEIAVLSNSGKTGSSISDVSVTDNTISSCGAGFSGIRYGNEGRGIKIAADSGAGTLSSIKVEDTTITQAEGEGIYIFGETGTVTIKQVMLKENLRGGLLFEEVSSVDAKLVMSSSVIRDNGDSTHDGVVISAGENTGGFEFYHNTFYDNARYGLLINPNSKNFTTSILKNNIFHSSVYKIHLVVLNVISLDSVQNNYFTEYSSNNIIGYPSGVFSQVASFNNLNIADEVSGNIGAADPLLDLSLDISSSSSPCYHAGVSGTGVSEDYSGNSFYISSPSIGAYEY